MSSGADLFVVCKQCGSEVSPYITECPYCGHRLRRRAPRLPRERTRARLARAGSRRFGWRVNGAPPRPSRRRRLAPGWLAATGRPHATIALVLASCGLWLAWQAGLLGLEELVIVGPLHGDWWKLFTSQLAYGNGWYEFVALLAIALFGWLLEYRHGPVVVLALFFGAGATGALVASAVFSDAIVAGGVGAALGLLGAWAVPDLQAARAGDYYEGDLLGVGAFAALLLALPLALEEADWVAALTGAAFGLVVGAGLSRMAPSRA
jgi:membrane associated rhomboid family serine protease